MEGNLHQGASVFQFPSLEGWTPSGGRGGFWGLLEYVLPYFFFLESKGITKSRANTHPTVALHPPVLLLLPLPGVGSGADDDPRVRGLTVTVATLEVTEAAPVALVTQ